MAEERIRAWHFMAEKGGKPVLRDSNTVEVGYVYSVEGDLAMCRWGLHQSRSPLDALGYAPGHWVSECEAWGDVEEEGDKFVARHREYLWVEDASVTLRRFARLCALDVIDSWDAPLVVRQWLETGDKRLRRATSSAALSAARRAALSAPSAAWSAAWSAASSAASSAAASASSAALSAAWNAASSAGWSAASSAVLNAAWSAGSTVARSAQNERLEQMLKEVE